MERPAAARFAFLMGIPVIAGAVLFKLRELDVWRHDLERIARARMRLRRGDDIGRPGDPVPASYLQNHNTDVFVVYRVGFAVVVAALLLMR